MQKHGYSAKPYGIKASGQKQRETTTTLYVPLQTVFYSFDPHDCVLLMTDGKTPALGGRFISQGLIAFVFFLSISQAP